MKTIQRLLICCRGEIAVRILRSAREMNMLCIVAHSSADSDSLAVRLADITVDIGPPHSKKSYLNQEAIIQAALDHRADAIHPGYGFLSENAEFAKRVVDAGLIFVGPDSITIDLMGNKAQAIETAKAAGVPIVPGSTGLIHDLEKAITSAHKIGYPILIKAAAGGGGRGIRIAYNEKELKDEIPRAQQEAKAAFGDDGIYLERYIAHARHIEVQILGDGQDVVHFFERDCSIQRRRQKIWEEAPAQILSTQTRTALCTSAVQLAKSVNYRGAGTLEYLYDEDTQEFFFIEMNTRIQVEHPITEAICGVDLIAAMLKIAQGEALPYQQKDIRMHGHAIEVRLNIEDHTKNFMPIPGTVQSIQWPDGPGIRIDTMIYEGYSIPPYYDSLIGKLIVWAEDRHRALSRLQRALDELHITGITTTAPLFQALLNSDELKSGQFHTTWLEQWLDSQQSVTKGANA